MWLLEISFSILKIKPPLQSSLCLAIGREFPKICFNWELSLLYELPVFKAAFRNGEYETGKLYLYILFSYKVVNTKMRPYIINNKQICEILCYH